MSSCINTNSYEYRSLLEKTGLAPVFLKAEIGLYQSRHNGNWPTPAEIDGCNTTKHAKQWLEISENNTVNNEHLTKKLLVESPEQAMIKLNTMDKYNDLEFDILPLDQTSKVTIKRRPSKYNGQPEMRYVPDLNVNSSLVFNNAFDKLIDKYGINFHRISQLELQSNPKFQDIVLTDPNPKAFILNGEIYINMDNYSVDSPVHELSHMMLGYMRFINPDMYQQLVSYAEQLPSYERLMKLYPNRTRNDINEEIFVTEYSKFITDQKSLFDNLDPETQYQIQFRVNRMMDIILDGSISVSQTNISKYGDLTLKELAGMVNSSTMTTVDSFPIEDSSIHRKLANMKSEMLKSGQLKEVCD